MAIIRLPDHLRDGIISGLGNHIGRKVEKGRAVAIFTYQCSESGEYEYTVDFKNTENAKTLATYQGHSKGTKATEAVPLYLDTIDVAKSRAENIDIGDGIFKLHHLPPEGEGPPRFYVEFTPPGTAVGRLGLVAKANAGERVPMQRVALSRPHKRQRSVTWKRE